MELGIIENDSTARDEMAARLLWTAAVIAPNVNVCGNLGPALDLQNEFFSVREALLFKIYMNKMKNHADNDRKMISDIEQMYKNILFYRKKKGKVKSEVIYLKKAENSLHSLLTEFRNHLRKDCEKLKITELLPLTHSNIEGKDKPILAYYFPEGDTAQSVEELILLMSTSMMADDGDFNFLDEEIKTNNSSADISMANTSDKIDFFSDFLFQLPSPELLTTQQMMVLRDQLSTTLYPLFKNYEMLFNILNKISFVEDNYSQIADEYFKQVKDVKSAMQQAIDASQLLNQLKDETQNGSIGVYYKISVGISSFENILNFYEQSGIVDKQIKLYIKEDMSTRGNIENTRLFFFLEKNQELKNN